MESINGKLMELCFDELCVSICAIVCFVGGAKLVAETDGSASLLRKRNEHQIKKYGQNCRPLKLFSYVAGRRQVGLKEHRDS